jgi:hypothetical protein
MYSLQEVRAKDEGEASSWKEGWTGNRFFLISKACGDEVSGISF